MDYSELKLFIDSWKRDRCNRKNYFLSNRTRGYCNKKFDFVRQQNINNNNVVTRKTLYDAILSFAPDANMPFVNTIQKPRAESRRHTNHSRSRSTAANANIEMINKLPAKKQMRIQAREEEIEKLLSLLGDKKQATIAYKAFVENYTKEIS